MGISATVLDPRRGYFFAILAAVSWGVSGSAAKYLFINGVTPFHLVQLDIVTLNLLGIVSGLFSAVGFAWYSIQGEYGMRPYSPWTVLFYALFFGALTWNIFLPPLESFMHARPAALWGWIVYIGILGTLVPFGLFLEGVNLIRATRASITATLEPIMAGLRSFFSCTKQWKPGNF